MFNLCDFLCDAAGIEGFSMDGVEVFREYQNIDILIRNEKSNEAVIIENNTWPGDQDRQLARNAEQLECEGYGEIHLLYLALDWTAELLMRPAPSATMSDLFPMSKASLGCNAASSGRMTNLGCGKPLPSTFA